LFFPTACCFCLIYFVFPHLRAVLAALGWAAILAIFFYPMPPLAAPALRREEGGCLEHPDSDPRASSSGDSPDHLVHFGEAFSVSRGVEHTLQVQQAPALAKTWVLARTSCARPRPQRRVLDMLYQGIQKEAGFLPSDSAPSCATSQPLFSISS